MTSQLKATFDYRVKSNRPFQDLVKASGFALPQFFNVALAVYEQALKSECLEDRVMGAMDEKTYEFREFDLNYDPKFHVEFASLELGNPDARKITDCFGVAAKDVMAYSTYLFDQVVSAQSEGLIIALFQKQTRRYRELQIPKPEAL